MGDRFSHHWTQRLSFSVHFEGMVSAKIILGMPFSDTPLIDLTRTLR